MVFFFVVFIMFTNFALLNLVTAVVVEQVFSIAQREAVHEARKQERERDRQIQALKQLFNCMRGGSRSLPPQDEPLDDTNSQEVTLQEFQCALEDSAVMHRFRQLGIAEYEATALFECLDVDGNSRLSIEEFV